MGNRTNSRDMTALARANAERSKDVAERLPKALRRAIDWTPATVSTTTGPGVAGGDTSTLDSKITDRNGDLRELGGDTHTKAVQTIVTELNAVDAAHTRLEEALHQLEVLDPIQARKLAEAESATGRDCVNPACRTWIPNTPENREREGRCEPCYRWRKRREKEGHPGEDRPHRLVHRALVDDCLDCHRLYTHQMPVVGCATCGRVYATSSAQRVVA